LLDYTLPMVFRGNNIVLVGVVVFLLGCCGYLFLTTQRTPVVSVISTYPRLSVSSFQAQTLMARTQQCILANPNFHLRDDRRPLGIREVRYVLTDRPQSWDIWAQNIPHTSTDVIEEIKSLGEAVSEHTLTLMLALDPVYLATLTDKQASIEFSESVNRALLKYCRGENQTSLATSREAYSYYTQQRATYAPLINISRE